MTLNDKCEIGVIQIDFLGFTIGENGIQPCQVNVRAIEKLEQPTNAAQLRQVLGAAGFYLRCVPNFADVHRTNKTFTKERSQVRMGRRAIGFLRPDETTYHEGVSIGHVQSDLEDHRSDGCI